MVDVNGGAKFGCKSICSGGFRYGGGLRSDVMRREIRIDCLALEHGGDLRL